MSPPREGGISGATRVACVIGDPVTHSRSPVIHNAAFAAAGLDWVFVAMPVIAGESGEAVRAMRCLAIAGMSVTMPHKEEVARNVDRRSSEAQRLGAVNSVVWEDGELVGHNTDGPGLIGSLGAQGVSVGDANVALLGAGGAARAVLLAVVSAGAERVTVINRDPQRAETAVAMAGERARVGDHRDVDAADIVVNATSVGMAANPGLPVDAASLGPSQVVVDLVYEPLETELLIRAREAGARTVDGLGMLVHQAAISFELWTGVEAPIEAMTAAADQSRS